MILYFNRTLRKIFEDYYSKVEFYDTFFADYHIDLTKCKYIHLYDETMSEKYFSTTIFFVDERIIVFKAELLEYYIPSNGYDVEIYLRKDIKSLKVTSDNQYNPTFTFKISFDKDIIEFTVKEQHRHNSDCKQTVKFLAEYWK